MTDSKTRHSRETKAQIAEAFHISRELLRQTGIVNKTFSDAESLLMSGDCSVNELYRLAIKDYRDDLFVKIPRGLKELAKNAAKERGMTLAEFVTAALIPQIFGEVGL